MTRAWPRPRPTPSTNHIPGWKERGEGVQGRRRAKPKAKRAAEWCPVAAYDVGNERTMLKSSQIVLEGKKIPTKVRRTWLYADLRDLLVPCGNVGKAKRALGRRLLPNMIYVR